MLKQIDENLWVVEQPQSYLGLEVGTRMTVIRLSNNNLILISLVVIDAELQQQLDALGKVKYLIAPNLFHYLYLEQAQQLYPDAITIAPPGLADKQSSLTINKTFTQDKIEFDGELEHTLLSGFQVFIPPKARVVNEIAFYHPATKTLIITDSAFNFDRNFPLVTQLAARVLGSYGVLKPSWLEKTAVKDKQQLQIAIERVLQWDFKRVIMAHGQIVDSQAKEKLKRGYQWLSE